MFKSIYLSGGLVTTASYPYYIGSEGTANLPDGPCIVAANHSSFLDGPLLALAYTRAKYLPLHLIAYEEPFHHPIMGWFLRSSGCIPFRRGDRESQYAMLTTALGWLKQGEAVGVFPEGHINQKQRLNRARPGAAMLALESGVPVIPAAITGSGETMPQGAALPKWGRRIRIRFGPPVLRFEKEREYALLEKKERARMIKDYGYRIMMAIGLLAGREPHG